MGTTLAFNGLIAQLITKNLQIKQSILRSSHPESSLLKKRAWHMCFPVNFVKFLRAPFFTKHLWWLILSCVAAVVGHDSQMQA